MTSLRARFRVSLGSETPLKSLPDPRIATPAFLVVPHTHAQEVPGRFFRHAGLTNIPILSVLRTNNTALFLIQLNLPSFSKAYSDACVSSRNTEVIKISHHEKLTTQFV